MRCPLGQGCRGEPAFRVALDLLDGFVGVGEERDPQGYEPVRVRRVPLLEEPVVPCPGRGQAELGVIGLREHPAAEPGDHRREVHRRPHSIDVHVLDAGVHVIAARPHMLETQRLHDHTVPAASDDGVHAGLVEPLALELPDLVASPGLHDARRPLLQVPRQPALEHVARFDNVVVYRDDRKPRFSRVGVREEDLLDGGHRPGTVAEVDVDVENEWARWQFDVRDQSRRCQHAAPMARHREGDKGPPAGD